MRIAVSNIAWDISEDEAVASLLRRYDVDAIDVAPGKYFPDPAQADPQEIERVRKWWLRRGIEITGMQALLFGTDGLNVFGDVASQEAMLEHLKAVFQIASGLGAKCLVFGSPKNRNREGLSDQEASDGAVDFFRKVGAAAKARDVLLCLEPNPTCYGANFMTTSGQTAQIVTQIDHPAIKMQFDTGALTLNNENPDDVLGETSHLIGHIHASEPNLVTLGEGGTLHAKMGAAVFRCVPDRVVAIEMRAADDRSHVEAIEAALKLAIAHYREMPGTETT